MSPGVAGAHRAPARNSRNGCNSAGRVWPKSRSQTSEPNDRMQDKPPLRSRKPTARNRLAISLQSERTALSASVPGLTVTTRKIAAGVSGEATSCDKARTCPARPGAGARSSAIRWGTPRGAGSQRRDATDDASGGGRVATPHYGPRRTAAAATDLSDCAQDREPALLPQAIDAGETRVANSLNLGVDAADQAEQVVVEKGAARL